MPETVSYHIFLVGRKTFLAFPRKRSISFFPRIFLYSEYYLQPADKFNGVITLIGDSSQAVGVRVFLNGEGHFIVAVLNGTRWSRLPGDAPQCLRRFLVGTAAGVGGGSYWCLVGRGRGCCPAVCNAQDGSWQYKSIWPQILIAMSWKTLVYTYRFRLTAKHLRN